MTHIPASIYMHEAHSRHHPHTVMAKCVQVRKIRELLLGSTEASIARLVEGELATCGHFQPLMPLYPFEGAASGQYSIAFSEHDRKLRENSGGLVARVGQKRKQTVPAGAAQATA